MNKLHIKKLLELFVDLLTQMESKGTYFVNAGDFWVQRSGARFYLLSQAEVNTLARGCRFINDAFPKAIVIEKNPHLLDEADEKVGTHRITQLIPGEILDDLIERAADHAIGNQLPRREYPVLQSRFVKVG